MTADDTSWETTQQQTRPVPHGQGPRVIADRYAIIDELGRGGMGVVWRAEDRVIGRQVAVKEIRLGEAAEDVGAVQERVLREVRTGGRLNEASVVTVYDIVHEGDSTFIVMELVQAPTLADLVDRHGPMSPQQAAVIGTQVLSALQAAHDMGIVHRDVKPANIMVGPNGRVKLTDFGIARAVDDPRLTTSGAIVGSPAFIAPEVVEGHPATPASDLWSLGITLFAAVEGRTPFDRPTTAAVLHAILAEVPVLSRAQGPLASAIMGMLIRPPEARIQAAQAQALLQQASGEFVAAPTCGYPGGLPPMMHTGPRPARPGGIRRALLIGVAVLAVVMLVGGFFLGRWSAESHDSAMAPTLMYGPDAIKVSESSFSSSSQSCFNGQLVPGHTIDSHSEADCKDPHDFEVVGAASILGSDSSDGALAAYPDISQLRQWSEDRCRVVFHSNGINPADSPGLNYRALIPTSQEWDAPGKSTSDLHRDAYCLVSRRDNEQLDHSVLVSIK